MQTVASLRCRGYTTDQCAVADDFPVKRTRKIAALVHGAKESIPWVEEEAPKEPARRIASNEELEEGYQIGDLIPSEFFVEPLPEGDNEDAPAPEDKLPSKEDEDGKKYLRV
jgi:hypothetical protein